MTPPTIAAACSGVLLVAIAGAAGAAGGQRAARRPACLASSPVVREDGAAANAGRRARFVAALDPCMAAMHAAMHAALHAPADGPADGADAAFAAAMVPHHQGAVDMARQLLVHGRDPELRAFALGVIAEQQAEIAMLESWVSRHAAGAPRGAAPRPERPRPAAVRPR